MLLLVVLAASVSGQGRFFLAFVSFSFFLSRPSRLLAASSGGQESFVFDATAALRAGEPLARSETRRILSNQRAKMYAGTTPRRKQSRILFWIVHFFFFFHFVSQNKRARVVGVAGCLS